MPVHLSTASSLFPPYPLSLLGVRIGRPRWDPEQPISEARDMVDVPTGRIDGPRHPPPRQPGDQGADQPGIDSRRWAVARAHRPGLAHRGRAAVRMALDRWSRPQAVPQPGNSRSSREPPCAPCRPSSATRTPLRPSPPRSAPRPPVPGTTACWNCCPRPGAASATTTRAPATWCTRRHVLAGPCPSGHLRECSRV